MQEKLLPLIEEYKILISSSKIYSEIYKWESLSNFKNSWDLEAQDLPQMFENAFPGNNNLWSSNNYYPIAVLKGFSATDPEGVIEAIEYLLDEKIDLSIRITRYRELMDQLLIEDNRARNVINKYHYQDGRTIGLLLAFNYPNRHFLFKYNILKAFCERFELVAPKKGNPADQIIVNEGISAAVKEILVQDEELLSLHKERLTDKSYNDDDYNLLTQDFIYSSVTYLKDGLKYYVGGAYWDTADPQDRTALFLKDGVWINGYEDKFQDLVNSIAEGSQIALKTTDKKGNRMHIKCLGVVMKNHGDGQKLDVNWQTDFQPFVVPFTGGYWDTVATVTKLDHINSIFYQDKKINMLMTDNESRKHPLNQILYGPPGTGKTYHSINKALSIIDGTDEETLKQTERSIVKKRFEELVNAGQVVFTTFHQSMSYEDFIEGIKPKTISSQVQYEIEDGIFKKICQKARVKAGNLESVLEKFKVAVSEEDGKTALTIKGKGTSFDVIYRGTNVFYVQPHNSTKENPWYPVNINNIRKAFETDVYTDLYNPTYIREILNYLLAAYGLAKGKNEVSKNYVLIIDEINRGNVSQILGELITLIEEDKRLGEEEALEVTLPYSKEKFGVPPNLYIIGTMNTADRSVEALDTALRRRFSFEEMPPKYKLKELEYEVYGYAAADILKTINHRIEKLLDRDHAIGHSYFIDKNEESTVESFYKCIIPLLQEYFFGDYGKIGLVLGKGFIEKKEWGKSAHSFADFDYDNSGDYDEKEVFQIIDYRVETTAIATKSGNVVLDFGKALKILMNDGIE